MAAQVCRGLSHPVKAAKACVAAAIAAASPKHCVQEAVRVEGSTLTICDHEYAGVSRVTVLGAGKAVVPMAEQLLEQLGPLVPVTKGVVVTKVGGDDGSLEGTPIAVLQGSHPVPCAKGVAGTQALLELASTVDEDTVVIVLLSGGGSALLTAPAQGLTLADLAATSTALLGCGAPIQDLNTLRKALSQVKGGRLAAGLPPARAVHTLVLSDVIGDDLSVIASGPTVASTTTAGDALEVVKRRGLEAALPPAVLSYLRSTAGEPPAGPPPGAAFHAQVIGSNAAALTAAAEAAESLGYPAHILTDCLEGEAREAAGFITALGRSVGKGGSISAPAVLIFGGETTVTLTDVEAPGKGGRNQELALAAAVHLAGLPHPTVEVEVEGEPQAVPRFVLAAVGTDGTDGPTDAAGGVVTTLTCREDVSGARAALAAHDAYPYLSSTGGLHITGPTGTNVMDITLLVVPGPPSGRV